MSVVADAASGAALRDATGDGHSLKRTAWVMTWALALLLVWLPLQTPIAIAIFQYGHQEVLSRATLLLEGCRRRPAGAVRSGHDLGAR